MQITDEIRKILACSSRLTHSLQTTMRDAGIEPSADLAASLCAVDPEQALEDLLFPATKSALAVLDPRQPEFVDTWSVAKSVLAWLSLLAVDGEWLGQASRSALSAGKLGFESRPASSVSRSSSRLHSASNSSVPAIDRLLRGCVLRKARRKWSGTS